VLQCVAVCCSVLQCVAVCCSLLLCVAVIHRCIARTLSAVSHVTQIVWMSHVTYVNESCHVYTNQCEWVTSQNESRHICEWVKSRIHEACEWGMSHMWMSHVTYTRSNVNECICVCVCVCVCVHVCVRHLYILLHVEWHLISISNPDFIGLFWTERGNRDLET